MTLVFIALVRMCCFAQRRARIVTARSLLRNKCLLVRQILAFLLNVVKMG